MDQQKYSILLVDDDKDLRAIYAYNFKNANFEVTEANDGMEGLKIAKEHKPDVIFTGIMMPNMDGWEFLKVLKNNVETSSIPVLISSHLGKEEDRKKAMRLGAKQFLVKGMVSPVEITAIVKELLTRKSYIVSINAEEADAPKLVRDLDLTPPIKVELSPGQNPGELSAKILKN